MINNNQNFTKDGLSVYVQKTNSENKLETGFYINGYDNPTISARHLHSMLNVGTEFAKWFSRMREYGFEEKDDYMEVIVKNDENSKGGRPATDFNISIDMAKHICMIQRTPEGKRCRQYLIDLEKAWNSPEQIYARALKMANKAIDDLRNRNFFLEERVAIQTQQLAELQPKVSYYDIVLNCKDLISISVIAKDYGWSANKMNKYLAEKGIQYSQGEKSKKIWLIYQKYAERGYTSTKTHVYNDYDGKPHTKLHTYWTQSGRLFIYDLLKSDGILPLIERD